MNRATLDAVESVYGLRLEGDAIGGVAHEGQTARRITREILRAQGLGEAEIERGLERWCERASARYVELVADADTSAWQAAPRAAETLAELGRTARLALVTGNPEEVARARMDRLALAGFFPRGQGAFGCEADTRPELIGLARERAGGWPAEQTVEVGDTPSDVEGSHAAGVRCVAVASGRFDRSALAGADAIVGELFELPDVLPVEPPLSPE